MNNGKTQLLTNVKRPEKIPFSDFENLLDILDKNKNGAIDEIQDVVLTDNNKDGIADKVTPLSAPLTGKIVRFERRGKDEIGDYLRDISKLDFIFPKDETKIAAQIFNDLGVFLSGAEFAACRIHYDKNISYVLVDTLTRVIAKKLKSIAPQLFKLPNLALNAD